MEDQSTNPSVYDQVYAKGSQRFATLLYMHSSTNSDNHV